MITEKELLDALKNPDELIRITPHFFSEHGANALFELLEIFPDYRGALAQVILMNVTVFNHFAQYADSFEYLAKIFPNDHEAFAQFIVGNPKEFHRLTEGDLSDSYLATGDMRQLRKIVNAFPQQASKFAQLIFNNADLTEFKRLTTFGWEGNRSVFRLAVLTDIFPQHADGLVKLLVNNPAEFQRLTKGGSNDVRYLIDAFSRSDQVEQFVQLILNNLAEFQRLTEAGNLDLERLKWVFPRHINQFAQLILSDVTEFKRFAEDGDALKRLAGIFPRHSDIFGKPTVAEALVALYARPEPLKNPAPPVSATAVVSTMANADASTKSEKVKPVNSTAVEKSKP